jgi:hypothetical protein
VWIERKTVPKPAVPGSGLMSLRTSAFMTSSDFAATIARFHSSGAGGLLAGDEARTKVDASRTQHQRCRDAAPIENASGRHNRDWRHCIDDLWHERHRADLTTIATGLTALRDDDVDSALGRLHRLGHGRDLPGSSNSTGTLLRLRHRPPSKGRKMVAKFAPFWSGKR